MIKFRAWDKYEEVMCEVLSIDFYTDVIELYFETSDEGWTSDIKDIILEQWTGLVDVNGKEIYEGDKIRALIEDPLEDYKYHQTDGYIYFSEDYHAYFLRKNEGYIGMGLAHYREMEVIGNIHEEEENE